MAVTLLRCCTLLPVVTRTGFVTVLQCYSVTLLCYSADPKNV